MALRLATIDERERLQEHMNPDRSKPGSILLTPFLGLAVAVLLLADGIDPTALIVSGIVFFGILGLLFFFVLEYRKRVRVAAQIEEAIGNRALWCSDEPGDPTYDAIHSRLREKFPDLVHDDFTWNIHLGSEEEEELDLKVFDIDMKGEEVFVAATGLNWSRYADEILGQ